jgi:hypothetical protein
MQLWVKSRHLQRINRCPLYPRKEIWRDHDIKFEDLAAGDFRVSVPPSALDRPQEALRRHRRRRSVHN